MRNKLRTRVFQQEGRAGINDLLTNETYQKDKVMLALLNTRIKEMLGENLKQLKDKMIELSEAKKGVRDVKHTKKAKPDFLDMDKDGDKKEPMKKAVADKKDGPKKGVNPFAKKDKNESVVRSKRVVAESTDNVLSFRDMIKLVQESGGQQAIDPIDTTLFAWAQRVAASKYTESAKAEVFAGMLYERNGGRFEMYDVLSENQK
jgi:hypothetical protein